ncbi:hypothetical protein CCAX7_59370 [Capsulimonas corticalis]|uniref:Uncharacterized protein n=1 Tax=Capsulimonas corticalis TaxID=2219043 RepID=A0A402CZP2_9BACT|nr:hypothetical protein CCAX7_59370 [Capsulimonas corticalis]
MTPMCLVAADGVTTKTAQPSCGHITGAQIARRVVDAAISSSNNGAALVSELNADVASHFYPLGMNAAASPQPACVFACLRVHGDELLITQVGDVGVRINGRDLYLKPALIDTLTSSARAQYIHLTGDAQGGREFILPLLQAQSQYRNNAVHPLGYGVIDGGATPEKFVTTTAIALSDVRWVEIFTDGYPEAPAGASIEEWEQRYLEVTRRDPDRCKEYPATKTIDDRTVVIARVNRIHSDI